MNFNFTPSSMHYNLLSKTLLSLTIITLTSLTFAQETRNLNSNSSLQQEPLQNVGISNIETRYLYTISTDNSHNLRNFVLAFIRPQHGGPVYHIYDLSFLANGTHHLVLGIEESENYSSLEMLQEIKVILAEMPAIWLSQMHFLIIRNAPHFTFKHGEFKHIVYQNTPDHKNKLQKLQQDFPQLLPKIEGEDKVYFAIQIYFHYPEDTNDIPTYREGAKSAMQHELGHLIAYIYYGSPYPDQDWKTAVLTDNSPILNISVDISEYNDHLFHQDFAEAVAIYLQTQNTLNDDNPIRETSPAEVYPHRFAILDKIMDTSTSQRH